MTPNTNVLSNLTKEQQDLLRLIVEKYPVDNPTRFIVTQNVQTSALGYGRLIFRITADETDFYQLERERLITLTRTPSGLLCGKPTQFGITAIEEESTRTASNKDDTPAANIVGEGDRRRASVNEFRKQGQFSTICFEGKTIIVRNTKGTAYIAHLLQNPRKLVLAADLYTAAAGVDGTIVIGSAGMTLDSTASAEYRAHAEDLRERLCEAERNNDEGTKAAVSEELERVADEMIAAKCLGGRSRQSGNDIEKFRKAVSMAIGRSIDTIRKDHATLADHLHRYVERGHFLMYSSDLTWQF